MVIYTNAVASGDVIDDPIYSAHREVYDTQLEQSTYLADYPFGTLGCIEKASIMFLTTLPVFADQHSGSTAFEVATL